MKAKILSVAAALCFSFSAGVQSATEMPNMLAFPEKYGLGDQAMSLCAIRGGEACMTSGSSRLFYLRVGQMVDSGVYMLSMENGDSASRSTEGLGITSSRPAVPFAPHTNPIRLRFGETVEWHSSVHG